MPKIIRTLFFCLECDKVYKNNNSLGNHNRLFHKNCCENKIDIIKNDIGTFDNKKETIENKKETNENKIIEPEPTKKIPIMFECKYCNKSYNIRRSRDKHQKSSCKEKESPKIINNNNTNNSHNTTNNNITNNNNNNNNTFNITYNFNSKENKDEYEKVKTMNDKKKIELLLYSDPINYILKIVEMFNCGDNKNFANVLINNLKSKFIGISQDGEFISEYKDTVLNKVIDNSYWTLSAIHDDIKFRFNGNGEEINLTKPAFKKLSDKYIDFSDNYYDTKNEKNEYFLDENPEIKYKSFDALNKERISLLLYNNRFKIKNKHDEKEEE